MRSFALIRRGVQSVGGLTVGGNINLELDGIRMLDMEKEGTYDIIIS